MKITDVFEDIIENHSDIILNRCRSMFRKRQDIEDSYQESLINIWKGLPKKKKQVPIEGWVSIVARNTCINIIRSMLKQPYSIDPQDICYMEDEDITPEKRALYADLREMVMRLGDLKRGIIIGYYFYGYTTKALSQIHHKSPGYIRNVLMAARKQLREEMEDGV